jgi:hypothetical protein
MEHIIDYAGIIPPSNLDIKSAFRNYIKYISGEEKWMIGKFIIPARKLISLSFMNETEELSNPVELAVLLTDENLFCDFNSSLYNDIKNIKEINSSHFSLNTFELKLPLDLCNIDNFCKIPEFLDKTYYSISESIKSNANIFFELNINDDWKYLIPVFSEMLSNYKMEDNGVGFKFHTGNIIEDSIPSTEKISLAIFSCNDAKVPFKATAGFHHPIRCFDNSTSTKMHGFINVFGAGIQTFMHKLSKESLAEIINDENPENFVFSDNGFNWKNFFVDKDEIEFTRNNFMISFRSDNFDKPREDLKYLNLLE